MSDISPTLWRRWRFGERATPGPPSHVGPAKPAQRVRLRRGVMDKLYQSFTFRDGSHERFGTILQSEHNAEPWQGQWRDTGPWIDLPNIESVEINQSYDQNGVATATIRVENVVAKAYAGLVGTYHEIQRGALSPLLGFAVMQRIASRRDWSAQANEWLNVLNGGYKVLVEQGYGDETTGTFVGIIDDCDVEVTPDFVTITCRDFGAYLTDQRVFGHNKAREIRSPVVFCDRLRADDTKHAGSNARASSVRGASYAAANVLRVGDDQHWESQRHDDPEVTEWVEIHLPPGRYTSFWLWPAGNGMECYISAYVRGATVDGVDHEDGWVGGPDLVPGDRGGHPYIRHIPTMRGQGQERQIGVEINATGVTTLRVSFRHLLPVIEGIVGNATTGGSTFDMAYAAGVNRLVAFKRTRKKEAKQKHWILVDDATDVVKWCLMWAGFHEWEVESFGSEDSPVRLQAPMVVDQSKFLIDPINTIKGFADYVFYIGQPSDENSLGVPVFRQARVLQQAAREQVTQDTLLTDVTPKFSKEALSYIIRVRGKAVKRSAGGVPLGQDTEPRVQAAYLPPWSGAYFPLDKGGYKGAVFPDRLSGLRKHVIEFDKNVSTPVEALEACVLIAIQEALASFTASVEIPAHPGLELDEALSVIDQASGINSRLYVANRHTTFTAGTQATFTGTYAGSIIDTPDMQQLVMDRQWIATKVRSEPPLLDYGGGGSAPGVPGDYTGGGGSF